MTKNSFSTRLRLVHSLIIMGIAATFLQSCGSYSRSHSAKSPDNSKSALLYVKDGGAAIASRVYIHLELLDNQKVEKVFIGVGGWPLEAKWISDTLLVIRYCGASFIEFHPNVYYEYRGLPEEVQIALITDQNSKDYTQYGLMPCATR